VAINRKRQTLPAGSMPNNRNFRQHIAFLRAKSSVHVHEVDQLNRILRRSGLQELPVREWLGTVHYLEPYEIQTLGEAARNNAHAVDRAISKMLNTLDNFPILDFSDYR